MEQTDLLKEILAQFSLKGSFQAKPYGNGHINQTYLITQRASIKRFILQKINHHVFQNPNHVQENIFQCIQHMHQKTNRSSTDLTREEHQLILYPTRNQRLYYHKQNHGYWRLYNYIPQSRTYERVQNKKQAFEAGKMIGRFQKRMVDFPPEQLHETIPHFHDLQLRLEQFEKSLKHDSFKRKNSVKKQINFVQEIKEEMLRIPHALTHNLLPIRVTHNDTKFNNILFDSQDEAIGLIDLDTVMPGIIHYDYGDALRSITNSSKEDEPDVNRVFMRLDLFMAFTEGYLKEAHSFLSKTEINYLADAPLMMTYMVGVRFLTDYLNGDTYFKTQYPEHNLHRARAQLQLVRSMVQSKKKMNELIEKFCKKYNLKYQKNKTNVYEHI